MGVKLRIVLCIVMTIAMAVLATVVAVVVLDIANEQANDFAETSRQNTKAVNSASARSVEAAVQLVQERTNTLIATSVRDFMSVAYIPVEWTRLHFSTGELDVRTMVEVENVREFLFHAIKAVPQLRWVYLSLYPNGEWIAYERAVIDCAATSAAKGWPANWCRNGELFNWLITEECCSPVSNGSKTFKYHYVPVNPDTGMWIGNVSDGNGVARWDANIEQQFGAGALQFDGPWQDNGLLCCGYTALHASTADPVPAPGQKGWRQPFMWTTQYLIGWNSAMYMPDGRYLGVISAEFSLEYLGDYLRSLRKPEFKSEEFFVLDARDGGGPEDEALIASSCLKEDDGTNTCGLMPRTLETDPTAPWPLKNTYVGARDKDGDGLWDPTPFWEVADFQGGLAREVQKLMWREWSATTIPQWDVNCTDNWCGGVTQRPRSWAEYYKQHPPHQMGPTRTAAWGSNLTFGGAQRFLFVSSMSLGSEKTSDASRYLRWVVVSTVESREYMQGIWDSTARADVDTQRQTERMESELDDARTLTVIIVVSIGVAVLVATFFGVYSSLLPLKHLGDDMHAAAVMDLENCGSAADGTSAFSEIHTLQVSFFAMVASLKELRNYMPQSALVESDSDGEAEASAHSKSELGRSRSDMGSSVGAGRVDPLGASMSGSRASRSLRASNRGGRARRASRAFQTEHLALKHKKCTVLQTNLLRMLQESEAELSKKHSAYVSSAVSQAKPTKGIVETFLGDRLIVHFNALVQSQQHQVKACRLSSSLASHFPIVGAVVCAQNHCGNIGVDGMKRFALVGPGAPTAAILLGVCKIQKVATLVDASVTAEVDKAFYLKACARVRITKLRSGVWTAWLLGQARATGEEDEWMYQLEKADQSNPYRPFNKAFECVCAGQTADFAEVEADDVAALKKIQEEVPSEAPETWHMTFSLSDAL
eukprot:TRINITY_DN419_c0_g1_i9.p1 TRINITY_DN419_c0_g1~~TRINITY_DN419_c0_g1_i9.p1  ORF type:complete len:936 (+),score=283.28 TRINITY_DN419_c0_g1_i9:85-2892(+)